MASGQYTPQPNALIDTALLQMNVTSNYQLAKLLGVNADQISKTRSTGKAPANVFFGLYHHMDISLHGLRELEGTAGQEYEFVPINTPTDILWKAIQSGSESEIAALIGPKPKGL